jgi:hypothetical protein
MDRKIILKGSYGNMLWGSEMDRSGSVLCPMVDLIIATLHLRVPLPEWYCIPLPLTNIMCLIGWNRKSGNSIYKGIAFRISLLKMCFQSVLKFKFILKTATLKRYTKKILFRVKEKTTFTVGRDSSVSYGQDDQSLIHSRDTATSRPALGPTWSRIQWVARAASSLESRARQWSCTSI